MLSEISQKKKYSVTTYVLDINKRNRSKDLENRLWYQWGEGRNLQDKGTGLRNTDNYDKINMQQRYII